MTAILGIVNLTPDSYSDGGQFLDPARAVAQARALMAAGAAAIDLGPSSSHPGAPLVAPAIEIQRLAPVLTALVAAAIPVAVDSFYPETQRYALAQGAAFLNDIHGFAHPDFYPELAAASCRLIVMHTVHGVRPTERVVTDPQRIVAQIFEFFHQRLSALTQAGIHRERLILDPGMGFFLSSESDASLVVLQQLARLREEFQLPVLVSVSRKSFIQRLTGQLPAQAGAGTLSAELFAARQGVEWLRTHDVGALHDGLAVQDSLSQALAYNRSTMV